MSRQPKKLKPSKNSLTSTKRELWSGHYYSVTRDKSGRILTRQRWSPDAESARPAKRRRKKIEKPLEDRLFTDTQSRFNYIVRVNDGTKDGKIVTTSSKTLIKMPGRSPERRALYRKLKKKYAKYGFDVRRMTLLSTYDLLTGKRRT